MADTTLPERRPGAVVETAKPLHPGDRMLAVLGYRGLGATEYRVLGGLAWCDGDNGAYPYQKTLAAELSMSQRAVNHAIRKLRKRGIVVVTKQGPSKPALYTIHYPAAPAEGLRVKAEGRHAESRRVNEAEDTPKVRTKTRRTSAYRTGLNRTLPPNGTDSRRRQEPERSNPVPAAVDDRPTLASARARRAPLTHRPRERTRRRTPDRPRERRGTPEAARVSLHPTEAEDMSDVTENPASWPSWMRETQERAHRELRESRRRRRETARETDPDPGDGEREETDA